MPEKSLKRPPTGEARYAFLLESIRNAREKLIITSDWVSSDVINNDCINQLDAALERGLRVLMVYGW